MTLTNALIAGAVGLLTGAIGALIAPWVQWGVEKRKKRLERRQNIVDEWRKILSAENFDRAKMLNDPMYGPLRDLLTEDTLTQLVRPSNHVIASINSPTDDPDRVKLLREVARIEKDWGLI